MRSASARESEVLGRKQRWRGSCQTSLRSGPLEPTCVGGENYIEFSSFAAAFDRGLSIAEFLQPLEH